LRPRPDRAGVLLALLAVAVVAAAARAGSASAIAVEHAWARPTPPGIAVGAGYLELVNSGAADRLLAARSPRAARVEFHASTLEDGMARMSALAEVPVPAGTRVRFAPAGLHLMLLGLTAPLAPGERVPLTLVFAGAGAVATELEVVGGPAAAAASVRPMRVVTLAPHLTELVFAAGAGERLVGTLDTSDYPPAARTVARIGDVTHIDAERLLALHPDLVISWGDGSPADQLALLKRLGLPLLSLEQHQLADVAESIERLGTVFGTEAVAAPAAARLRAELATLAARYRGERRLRVFYQVWSTPLYTLGGRHVATEMLAVCGAENLFADQPRGAFMVDEESVYARDPDAIALAGTVREAAEWRARWGVRAPLRAVAAGAVFVLDPDLVNRMGPRIGAGTRALCERLAEARARAPALRR
jgi:iron complex transport system substrate-binding protein